MLYKHTRASKDFCWHAVGNKISHGVKYIIDLNDIIV